LRNAVMNKSEFFETGWCRSRYDAKLAHWVSGALPYARKAIAARENSQWLRCGGTWHAGINALPNRSDGSIGSNFKLEGRMIRFIHQALGLEAFEWDRAQVSVCFPGYPRPMRGESESAFQYRRNRDAAHIDGLLPEGSNRRRHLREFHGFILGIPIVEYSAGASPCVVWQGSHKIVRETFFHAYAGTAPQDWGEVDITETYHELRRQIFERCERIEIQARPGQAYLIHRLALHGVAPWQSGARATEDGRMICYFRPEIGGPEEWLGSP
jgi:hypothetical protein